MIDRPPFTADTAAQKVAWRRMPGTHAIPAIVATACTLDSRWRDRAEFLQGREAIEAFLTHKWNRGLDYRLTGDAA
jgi:nuclear transport factor 2 (NTF2) superfamily protein